MKSKNLFLFAILLAACSVLWRIEEFPIYFFCDEAVFAYTAFEWIKQGWRDAHGVFAPFYFEIAPGRNTPMFSSYLQAVSAYFFGFSVIVARSANAIFTLLGVVALSLLSKRIFAPKSWWLFPLIFASIPAWFVFSRTAFDLPISVALLGILIFFYSEYRNKSPKYIYPLVLCASAFFYTYASSQLVLPIITILLFLVDFKYHWQNRVCIAPAVLLALVLAIPAIAITLGPVAPFSGQMKALDSYLLKSISPQDKLTIFLQGYFNSFNPKFWLSADINELIRHRLLAYGYFPKMFIPFLIIGLTLNLWRFKTPAYRCLLICVVAVPVPAALCSLEINRILSLIIPFSLWTIIGLEWLLERIRYYWPIAILIFIALSANCIHMTLDAVGNGRTWYKNYGLYGLQFGTREIFETEIPKVLEQFPDSVFRISANFANNPNALIKFFFPNNHSQQIRIDSIDLNKIMLINDRDIFVLPANEFNDVVTSKKFKPPIILRELPYPDGTTGFYFVKLSYVKDVAKIFDLERERRLGVIEGTALVGKELCKIFHSTLDIGSLADIFDGDENTFIRGLEANPFKLEVDFLKPKLLSSLGINFGNIRSETEISIVAADQSIQKFIVKLDGSLKPGLRLIALPGLKSANKISFSIKNIDGSEVDRLHVFDLQFKFYEESK